MAKTYYKQDEIIEMVQFFCFACRSDTDFNGTIQFSFSKDKNDNDKFDLSVRIENKQVTVFHGPPPDKKVNVKLTMTTDDFFFVYSGKASGMDITQMILSGRIKANTYRVGDVSKFAKSFDFSSEKWTEFYSIRGTNPIPTLPEKGLILISTEDILNMQKIPEIKSIEEHEVKLELEYEPISIPETLKLQDQKETYNQITEIKPKQLIKDYSYDVTKNRDCDVKQIISKYQNMKIVFHQIKTQIRLFTLKRLFTRTLPFGSTQYNDSSDWWLMSRSIKNEYVFF